MNVHELLQFYTELKRIIVSLMATTQWEDLRLLFIYFFVKLDRFIGQFY